MEILSTLSTFQIFSIVFLLVVIIAISISYVSSGICENKNFYKETYNRDISTFDAFIKTIKLPIYFITMLTIFIICACGALSLLNLICI